MNCRNCGKCLTCELCPYCGTVTPYVELDPVRIRAIPLPVVLRHSPGPWVPSKRHDQTVMDAEGKPVCMLLTPDEVTEDHNQALIQNAPETLLALIELRDWYFQKTGLPAVRANCAISRSTIVPDANPSPPAVPDSTPATTPAAGSTAPAAVPAVEPPHRVNFLAWLGVLLLLLAMIMPTKEISLTFTVIGFGTIFMAFVVTPSKK